MNAFVALLKRDLVLSYRQGIDAWVVVLFFLAAGILFPFAIGPEPNALMRVSTGVVLSMAALAALLSLDRLYQGDFEDGSLDLMALGPLPLELAALAKALAHWLSTGLPLLVAAPLLALMLNAPADSYGPMLLALALATPALEPARRLGRRAHLGQPARRHPAHAAHPAALCAGADLRRRQHQPLAAGGGRPDRRPIAARRSRSRAARHHTLGNGGGAAAGAAIGPLLQSI